MKQAKPGVVSLFINNHLSPRVHSNIQRYYYNNAKQNNLKLSSDFIVCDICDHLRIYSTGIQKRLLNCVIAVIYI